MKLLNTFAGTMIAVSLMAVPAVYAAETTQKVNMHELMNACDMDHDGMMSRAEVQTHMDKMFDKVDVKKAGKLDNAQTEVFLKQFNTISGG